MLIFCCWSCFVRVPSRGGLAICAVNSGSLGPRESPGRGRFVVFLGKSRYPRSAYLPPPKCKMGTGEFNARGNPAMD